MSKRIQSAEQMSRLAFAFRCPLCASPVHVYDNKSLICAKNHTFDFAKQGFLNVLARPANSKYSKELFEARQSIIMESGLFAPLQETLAKVISEHADAAADPCLIADLGCGEGSHLQTILNSLSNRRFAGMGLDIAKEGVLLAAKRYSGPLWLVGDLAHSPLQDASWHVILNILSPANYKEFQRILAQRGLVIKVFPRRHYLKELREAVYGAEKSYSNEETVSLFAEHFQVIEQFQLTYSKLLNKEELQRLARMTPLAWSAEQGRLTAFLAQEAAEITVDLDILAGRKGEIR